MTEQTVTVLVKPLNEKGKSDCVMCDRTKARLDKEGIAYDVLTLDTPEAADEQNKAIEEGIQAAPVVIVRGPKSTVRWGGFRPDLIKSIILAHRDA